MTTLGERERLYQSIQFIRFPAAAALCLLALTVVSDVRWVLAIALVCVSFFVGKRHFAIWIGVMVTLLVLYRLGVIGFALFEQAESLLDYSPLTLILQAHPHAPRFAVAYPAIYIHKQMGVDVDVAYSYYCLLLIGLTIIVMRKIVIRLQIGNYLIRTAALFLSYLLVIYIMNGRLIPAYLGIVLIINSMVSSFTRVRDPGSVGITLGHVAQLAVGFLLTTVSSGTMMVSFFTIVVCFLVLKFSAGKPICTLPVTVLLAVFFILVSVFALLMTMRNIEFFSRDFLSIFEHGLGRLLEFSPQMLVLIGLAVPIALVALFTVFYIVVNRERAALPILFVVPISMLCGVFGIATASMFIPAGLLLFACVLPSMEWDQIR